MRIARFTVRTSTRPLRAASTSARDATMASSDSGAHPHVRAPCASSGVPQRPHQPMPAITIAPP